MVLKILILEFETSRKNNILEERRKTNGQKKLNL
jgi:hypothetical protein